MQLTVYLAGEIHSQWREEIIDLAKEKGLSIDFVYPQLDHDRSDDIGEAILGEQPNDYFRDDAASAVNNLRTTVLMQKADVVVALFGEDYRQWNTAMDATTAVNTGKPLIIIRPESVIHALKELSNKANLVVETPEQAVGALAYIFE